MADRDSLLQSLLTAADTAQQVYISAHAANPGADLSQLYRKEIDAQTLYFKALNSAFNGDPAASDAQRQLDAITDSIKADLSTITNVNTWIKRVAGLIEAATTIVGFFG
jgi:hypothetical protein